MYMVAAGLRLLLLLILCLATPLPASGAGPDLIDYQGLAVDASGQPINGSVAVLISVWRDATSISPADRIYAEQHTAVPVVDGVFSLQIGAGVPLSGALDPQAFSEDSRWLEVSINGERLLPRQRFTSVPYSLTAQRAADGVPAGAVMFFALSSCPAGWSPYAPAQGRALVGLPAGGILSAAIGTALAPQEDRQHAHTVDPPGFTSAAAGSHSHTVDPPATTSSASGASHTHTVDIAAFTSSSHAHRHDWAAFHGPLINEWVTYDATGDVISIIDWTDGMDTTGQGNFPLAVDSPSQNQTSIYYTSQDQHSHTLNPPPTGSTVGSADHSHDTDVAAFSSGAATSHSHTVDPPATSSSGAGTSSVMPYLQLLVCRKD